jgi:hypothetical protein
MSQPEPQAPKNIERDDGQKKSKEANGNVERPPSSFDRNEGDQQPQKGPD